MPLSADDSLSVLSREPKRPEIYGSFHEGGFCEMEKLSKMESARETKLEKIPMELPEIVFGSRCEIRVGLNPWLHSKKLRAV